MTDQARRGFLGGVLGGLFGGTAGASSGVMAHSTRLHPDDIETIAERVAEKLRLPPLPPVPSAEEIAEEIADAMRGRPLTTTVVDYNLDDAMNAMNAINAASIAEHITVKPIDNA